MAAFVQNWYNYLLSWGAVEKLQAGGLGIPDSKALKQRENEIKRLTKKFGSDYVAKMHSRSDDFLLTLEHQIEAGEDFAVGFKRMMQGQGWFKTDQDRKSGKAFTQVLWQDKAAPFFDRLKKEADFLEKRAGVLSRQAKKGITWFRSLSAFAFAWEGVQQFEADYRRALSDNLKGGMGFEEAEKNSWRALSGMDTARATMVATEFGEDYEALRRVQSEFYQLFRRDIKLRGLRQLAAMGRMMDLPAEDVAKYVFERKREFGVDAEVSQRELAEASVVYDDAVTEVAKTAQRPIVAPMRAMFFQAMRQAQQSIHGMPQDAAVAARVMAEHLKTAIKAGITTPEGASQYIKQVTELATSDPHLQMMVGQELYRRLDLKVAELRQQAKLDPARDPLDELGLRRQALEALVGRDLVAQAAVVDRYYLDSKRQHAESLKTMAQLFLQTTEGQATLLEQMQKLYDPMSREAAFAVIHSSTQDPKTAVALSGAIKSRELLKAAEGLRKQTTSREEDIKRAQKRRDEVIDAVSALPIRTYAWFKATWSHPWVKMFAALGLISGGIWWDLKVRQRLGMELSWAARAIRRLALAFRRKAVAEGVAQPAETTKDTKRVSWFREKLRGAWLHIRKALTTVRATLARWFPRLTKLLGGASRLLAGLRRRWRIRRFARLRRAVLKARAKGTAPKVGGRGGVVLNVALTALAAGSVIDEYRTKGRMNELQQMQELQQKVLLEQQLAEQRRAVRATTPEDHYENQAYGRIFADAHHLDILSHLNYVTTFDLGQQDAEEVEQRRELVQLWKETEPSAARIGGVTAKEAAEFLETHPPELYISEIGGAVVHALRWIKQNQPRPA